MKAFFFGCWNEPGHCLFVPGGQHAFIAGFREEELKLLRMPNGAHIDGGLAPRLLGDDTIVWSAQDDGLLRTPLKYHSKEAPQGCYLIHHAHGYTYMSWWDRNQGDKRGACNSTFILEGEHNAVAMYDKLVEFFPHVVENLRKAEIPLRQAVKP